MKLVYHNDFCEPVEYTIEEVGNNFLQLSGGPPMEINSTTIRWGKYYDAVAHTYTLDIRDWGFYILYPNPENPTVKHVYEFVD